MMISVRLFFHFKLFVSCVKRSHAAALKITSHGLGKLPVGTKMHVSFGKMMHL